jgi:hypothetical protein
LPALTSLCLKYFAFRFSGDDNSAEPFSSFNSLKSLFIHSCLDKQNHFIFDAQNLFISNATLVYLRIKTSSDTRCKIKLSTPSLNSFDFEGDPIPCSNLSSIKHVKIDVTIWSHIIMYPLVLLNWLVELSLIESLTVASSTLEVL